MVVILCLSLHAECMFRISWWALGSFSLKENSIPFYCLTIIQLPLYFKTKSLLSSLLHNLTYILKDYLYISTSTCSKDVLKLLIMLFSWKILYSCRLTRIVEWSVLTLAAYFFIYGLYIVSYLYCLIDAIKPYRRNLIDL